MSQQLKRVALVGCGHIHTPGFIKRLQGRDDVAAVAVWDHQGDRARAAAEELEARVVDAPEKAWNAEEVDGVVICAETDRHEDLVCGAAGAGKHLFVEKPLGMAAADGGRMADAVERAGVIFQTGYFMRGDPIHRFLRTHIERGSFGTITRIRHTNCHGGSLKGLFDSEWRWMADPAQAGFGGFGDLGTHSLDILLWLMGDVVEVVAEVGAATSNYPGCDEYGEGLLKFDSGAVGSIAAGWVDVVHPVSLILSGTKGHAYVCEGELHLDCDAIKDAPESEPWPHAFDLYLDALHGKAAPLVGVAEAAYRSAVMEALYRSSRTRRWETPATRD